MSKFRSPPQPGQSGSEEQDLQLQGTKYPQQPQYPPQFPQQPQFPPQQQPWQQPPLQPFPPQKPPKKHRVRRVLGIGCSSVIALIVLIVIISVVAGSHGNTTTNSSTNTALPTTQATQPATQNNPTQAPAQPTATPLPTKAPTAIATPLPTKASTPTATHQPAGPAILGAKVDAFIAKYGQPNQFSQPRGGLYNFSIYGHGQNDVTVEFLYGPHSDAVLQGAPSNAGWALSTAIATCRAFLPPDALYKRQMVQTNPGDIQRVYVSASLAKLFPASDFTDENGNPTTPGTIGMTMAYNLSNTTSFVDCAVQVGLQAS